MDLLVLTARPELELWQQIPQPVTFSKAIAPRRAPWEGIIIDGQNDQVGSLVADARTLFPMAAILLVIEDESPGQLARLARMEIPLYCTESNPNQLLVGLRQLSYLNGLQKSIQNLADQTEDIKAQHQMELHALQHNTLLNRRLKELLDRGEGPAALLSKLFQDEPLLQQIYRRGDDKLLYIVHTREPEKVGQPLQKASELHQYLLDPWILGCSSRSDLIELALPLLKLAVKLESVVTQTSDQFDEEGFLRIHHLQPTQEASIVLLRCPRTDHQSLQERANQLASTRQACLRAAPPEASCCRLDMDTVLIFLPSLKLLDAIAVADRALRSLPQIQVVAAYYTDNGFSHCIDLAWAAIPKESGKLVTLNLPPPPPSLPHRPGQLGTNSSVDQSNFW